ncbi:MAG: tetratricopeptide repeat protein [Candidatus Fermentibacteraceae bacterium]|nr:tetratricopeptide repeat protein [Candidatus Fermentibacteraceae bacterium]
MNNLIPEYIGRQYLDNRFHGDFRAVSMFVDISGFMKLTESLMLHEKDGAEVLKGVLNGTFDPVVRCVRDHGGIISTFAGDAFTALFPFPSENIAEGYGNIDAHLHAVEAAFFINRFFEDHRMAQTEYGSFEIGVKIGLSAGRVSWGILGRDRSLTYFFRGEAVDACAKAEHRAATGDIIADERMMPLIRDCVESEPSGTGYRLLDHRLDIPSKPSGNTPIDPSVQQMFVPTEVIDLGGKGEFRNACSVFISFTEPEDIGSLDIFATKVIDLANRYRAFFNKMDFGDKGGVMLVLFGAPVAFENDSERALDFLLALRDIPLAESMKCRDFKWRAGLAFGLVYSGVIGGDDRCEYTAVGKIVNLSNRLMMKAEWGSVYLTEQVRRLAGHKYYIEHSGDFNYKGIAEPVPTFLLLGKNPVSRQLFAGRMVGRGEKLGQLIALTQSIFHHCFGGIVHVDGSVGAGKSRLVHELHNSLAEAAAREGPGFLWLHLPCDDILRKSFNPFVHFLRDYFGQSVQRTTEENRKEFEDRFVRLLGRLHRPDPSDLAGDHSIGKVEESQWRMVRDELEKSRSILGALVNLFWEDSLYEQLDARLRYENSLFAIKNLIKAESLLQPVIIELEDGHSIDSDSLELLQVLTRNVEDFPFIVISACRYRDDGNVFSFGLQDVVENRIELEYLDSVSSETLIRDIAASSGIGDLPEGIAGFIFDKSEGNPFYIEQITLYLQENGYLEADSVDVGQSFSIPVGINSIIIARIDRLSRQVKDVIKAAAVIGMEFEIRILSAVMQADVGPQVRIAEEGQILSRLSELVYIFKHALLKDAVYDIQLRTRLRELHCLTARAIEKLCKSDLHLRYGDLAWHYEKAEIPDRAAEYLEKAGDQARTGYQNQQALDYYERLLSSQARVTEPSRGLEIDTLLKVSGILRLIGRLPECRTAAEKALSLSEEMSDAGRIALASRTLGMLFYRKGDHRMAMECFEKDLSICRETGDIRKIAEAVVNIGNVHRRKGDLDRAVECYEETLRSWRESGDDLAMPSVLMSMGLVHNDRGDYGRALEYFDQALEMNRKSGNRLGVSRVTGNMGLTFTNEGNYEKAMEYLQKYMEISRELGDKWSISIAYGNMGNVYGLRGENGKAMECFEKDIEISEELGDSWSISISVGNMGLIHTTEGRYDEAIECFDRAIALGRNQNANYQLCSYLVFKAEALYHLGDIDEAAAAAAEGIQLAEIVSRRDILIQGRILSAKIDFTLGHREAAVSTLEGMLAEAESKEDQADLHYELWRCGNSREESCPIPGSGRRLHSGTAVRLYSELQVLTPKAKYQRRILELKNEPG